MRHDETNGKHLRAKTKEMKKVVGSVFLPFKKMTFKHMLLVL